MSVVFFSRFVSVLALVALAGGIYGLVRSRAIARTADVRSTLGIGALVAIVSMLGSLTYSEYFLFEPCHLCWYQRIAMYPLAFILSIAWWKSDRGIVRYGQTLAGIGAAISVYHLVTQWVLTSSSCGGGPSCSVRYVTEFGFVTIPFMALAGFVAIFASLQIVRQT